MTALTLIRGDAAGPPRLSPRLEKTREAARVLAELADLMPESDALHDAAEAMGRCLERRVRAQERAGRQAQKNHPKGEHND